MDKDALVLALVQDEIQHVQCLALQLNLGASPTIEIATPALARAKINFNALDNQQTDWMHAMQVGADADKLPLDTTKHIKLWIGYSTACGPFQQIAICKDNTKL
ncbi:MAG: hypothetical protein EZS28_031930 [Streblomastix strix]|uniref:Uncharacterized protein n=1 Tax=Streblomastix strix TaxID=222440 RepID=A0A5J4UQU0_9EUKA|nr:MAG: hypothetical protein EZS28_031930 [Streblomastix strix]